MKALSLTLLSTTLLFAATGCSKKEPAAAVSSAANSSAPSSNPAPAPSSAARVVTVAANDMMKFDVVRIDAKPGEELKIVLKNNGSQPKATMGHNLVVLKAGTDVQAFVNAGIPAGLDKDFIAPAMADKVIAKTKMLGARESDEITFKAPAEAGEYPYVCTFLGHAALGMKGVLVVQ